MSKESSSEKPEEERDSDQPESDAADEAEPAAHQSEARQILPAKYDRETIGSEAGEETALAHPTTTDLTDSRGDSKQMPFLEHLEELRWRILKGLGAIVVGAVLCFVYSNELFGVLTAPFEQAVASLEHSEAGLVGAIRSWVGQDPADAVPPEAGEREETAKPAGKRGLQALRPMTLFFVNLQIAFIGGLLIALPVLFYQFWQFVAPGLLRSEKRLMLPIVGLSVLCFGIGALIAYVLVLPLGLRFFLALEPPNVTSQWAIDEYIGFVLRLILGFGIVFEMPVVTLFLSRLGLVTPEYLKRIRRYAIIVVFALAAIFTPPDPISQLLMALPLLGLYEISIWVCRFTRRRKDRDKKVGE